MKHQTVKEKEKQAFEKMKSDFHYKNSMAAPKMKKVVVATGTGTGVQKDKNRNNAILERLSKFTGQ